MIQNSHFCAMLLDEFRKSNTERGKNWLVPRRSARVRMSCVNIDRLWCCDVWRFVWKVHRANWFSGVFAVTLTLSRLVLCLWPSEKAQRKKVSSRWKIFAALSSRLFDSISIRFSIQTVTWWPPDQDSISCKQFVLITFRAIISLQCLSFGLTLFAFNNCCTWKCCWELFRPSSWLREFDLFSCFARNRAERSGVSFRPDIWRLFIRSRIVFSSRGLTNSSPPLLWSANLDEHSSIFLSELFSAADFSRLNEKCFE